jgi:hypothetical protein
MDVSFLLSLSACLSFVLYICTLFLSIQYRGDFGLIADADEIGGDVSALNKPSYDDNSRHTNRRSNDTRSEAVSMTRGIFDVPLADMSLLFSSISTSNNNLYNYGTKTHNLGMNLKDV